MEIVFEEETNDEEEEEDDGPDLRCEPLHIIYAIFHIIILIFQTLVLRRRQYMLQLLRQFHETGNIQIITNDGDDDTHRWMRPRRRNPPDPDRFPKVPAEKGMELMGSGVFGSNDTHRNRGAAAGRVDKKKRLARRILDRELARDDYIRRKENQRLMAQVR